MKFLSMNKILCIRLGYLGDILLCNPVLRAIKNHFPGVQIHFLTDISAKQLEGSQPSIDHWHYYQGSARSMAASLWKEKFDLVIDFQADFSSKLISFLLFRKKICLPKFQKNNNASHLLDHYFHSLQFLGIQPDGQGIDWKLSSTNLSKFKLPESYGVFALGARRVTRVISYPKMIELVERWEGKLVLLGDDWDKNFGDRLAILYPEKVINLCEETSIVESAQIIDQAERVITHNSMMMHLAAALKKQPFVLYTNTSPQDGYTPYQANFTPIELPHLTCKPCINIEKDVCPLHHFACGMNINLDAIFE